MEWRPFVVGVLVGVLFAALWFRPDPVSDEDWESWCEDPVHIVNHAGA